MQMRGQLWGQVSKVNFPYVFKSMSYIEYSVVLAQPHSVRPAGLLTSFSY